MPVFSDEVLEPDQKRDIIAYIQSLEESPALRRLDDGLARSGQ